MKYRCVLFLVYMIPAYSAHAHLAIDHLKQGLESRYSAVEASEAMDLPQKEVVLGQIEEMQGVADQVLSLSYIPSQEQYADEMLKELNQDLQDFDKSISTFDSN